ncbi:MAG TPA: hypothetical protein VFV67_23245 [Actinophytocola sp.]|uniref:hypothetical protein n=1 Tax=Actinophytocola sp. TaxID=1872138 RepID=UPI002DBF7E10|nr:hypothetical protein [Actinophytocola sp.]HEU5473573.1 hypothetical protein [Actinophytocola sp.]
MIHRYATVEGVHHAIQTAPTVQDGHLVVVPAVGEAAVVCGTFPIAFQVPNQAAYAASALSLYTKAFAYEGSIWNSSAVDRTEITARGKQMVEYMKYAVGTPEQVERFVRPFLADTGAPLTAMAFSEPEGSANFDAEGAGLGVRTTAVPDGDSWVINGRKAWASHLPGWDGDGPDLMTIVCRTPGGISLIVAERQHLAGHIEVEEYYDLPGLKGCLTTRVPWPTCACHAATCSARKARASR